MKRTIYFISLLLFVGFSACTSSEKEDEAAQATQMAQDQEAHDKKMENLKTESTPTPPPAIGGPTPEIDNKSISDLVPEQLLMEVLEIHEPDMLKKKVDTDGNFVINWPNPENPEEQAEFSMTRGDAFEGTMEKVREMAEGPEKTFYDDIGSMGGYYEAGEENSFFFPLGGFVYKMKFPEVYPTELKAEKGHQLALRILEANQ